MERLTGKNQFGYYVDLDKCSLQEATNRLAAYEEAEEQGLLIRLPCKVGDTVWVIIKGYTYGDVGDPPDVWYRVDKREFDYNMIPEYGKTVFLTREEAEAALKEIENGTY